MEEFTQKWAIIALLEDVRDGATFYYTDFPLHITLAGVFAINKDGSWLAEGLSDLLTGQKRFEVQADKKDMFGPHKDVAVMKIAKTPELTSLYSKIHQWLLESGARYNEPQYQGSNYLPHSTFQKSGLLHEDETRQIKSVSIIDLFPNGDGHQRKICKTIKFE
jgi:2'-5' RNA ligase